MATAPPVVRHPKGSTKTTSSDRDGRGAVDAASEAIREMIRRRALLPGEPVRQQDMATQLEMSRVPIREALNSLEKEGLLSYERNRGYFVAKLSSGQLQQIDRMAHLLESAMVEDLDWPDAKQLRALTRLNKQLAEAAKAGDVGAVAALNREFHEGLYELSPSELIHREVRRLWDMAESYRALYLAGPARDRIAGEHERILDALKQRDRKLLEKTLNDHRGSGFNEVAPMLGL